MTISLKHKFTSAIPDAGDPTIVQPSNWNDEHALTQATSTILGRVTAGTGVTEELTPAQTRTLLNVADGATANSTDAFLLARANHTGTQSADTLTDGTTNKAFLATERTKLAGIATGATANSTDAFLLARANHTGTQLAATISDFSTAADLRIAAAVGVSVQAFNANTTSWAAISRAAGFDTFAATPTSANLRALLSDEVGTGAAYFVGGALGTPASGVATNLTGLPLTTGVTGTLGIANGGTGQITASAAFDALSPTTTRGDLIFRNATTNTRLAASTSGFHLQTNGAGTDPIWAGFSQPLSGSPAIRTWNAKAADRADLRDWNGLDMTDTNDMASLLSAALTAVAGTGDTLWIPAGTMALGSVVNFPAEAKIQGEGAMGSIYGGLAQASQKKTILHFNHTGVGLFANAAYGAEMRGITTYRTQPAPAGGWTPTAHDFDIKIMGSADVVLEDITILNGTKGILAIGDDTITVGTGAGCGRLSLTRIKGQPMNTGIELRNCYDVVWMDEIGFWPFWSNDTNVRAYQRSSATAFNLFRVDNPKVGRIFSLGYLQNLNLSLGAAGVNFPASLPGGSVSKGYFDTVGGDSAAYGLRINTGATPTVVIDKLYGHSGAGWAANGYLVRDSGTNSRVSIGHLEMGQNTNDMLLMDGSGGLIMADRSKIYQWDQTTIGASAFNVGTGNKLVLGPIDKDATASPLFAAASAGIIESEEWVAYTATVAAITGTITTMGTQITRYQRKGRKVTLNFDITITTIGTGANGLTITLPVTAAQSAAGSWLNTATNAGGLSRVVTAGTTVQITPFPVASGQRFLGSIEYEVA